MAGKDSFASRGSGGIDAAPSPGPFNGGSQDVFKALPIHQDKHGVAPTPVAAAEVVKKTGLTVYGFSLDMFAAAIAGAITQTAVAPFERVKVLLQTQDSNRHVLSGARSRYKGIADCLTRVIHEQGMRALWRGNGADMLRHVPTAQFNFAFRDLYRSKFPQYDPHTYFWSFTATNLAAGAAAGVSALTLTYPLDFAHTRLAADIGTTTADRQFHGVRHVLRTVYRTDSWRGLFRGYVPSVQGIVVHRSLYFGLFDTAKEVLVPEPGLGPLWKRWAIAQAVATTASLASYPFNTVRHRMMMQSGEVDVMYASTRECWRRILREEGLWGFYKGAFSGVIRSTGAAFVLVLYDEVKRVVHRTVGPRDAAT